MAIIAMGPNEFARKAAARKKKVKPVLSPTDATAREGFTRAMGEQVTPDPDNTARDEFTQSMGQLAINESKTKRPRTVKKPLSF